jgi:hypothetical protein
MSERAVPTFAPVSWSVDRFYECIGGKTRLAGLEAR